MSECIIKQLRKARIQACLSQSQLGPMINTTGSAISRLENGGGKKGHSPSLDTLKKFADALNCEIEMRLVAKRGE